MKLFTTMSRYIWSNTKAVFAVITTFRSVGILEKNKLLNVLLQKHF